MKGPILHPFSALTPVEQAHLINYPRDGLRRQKEKHLADGAGTNLGEIPVPFVTS